MKRVFAVPGYYDGTAVRPLENMCAKPNQKVIITIMDEFVELTEPAQMGGMRGALAEYADPALSEQEKGAWQRAVVEKYGNA